MFTSNAQFYVMTIIQWPLKQRAPGPSHGGGGETVHFPLLPREFYNFILRLLHWVGKVNLHWCLDLKKKKHLGKRPRGLFSSVSESLKEGGGDTQFGIHLVHPFRACPTSSTCLSADSSRWKQKASSLRTSLWTCENPECL